MVKGPRDNEPPAFYENTHIMSKEGVSTGTITIHIENFPEQAMMDFQAAYHKFKKGFREEHKTLFMSEEEEEPPATQEQEPVTATPTPPVPAPNLTPAPEENKSNGAGEKRERMPWRGEWSETEKETVRNAKNKDDAVKAYRVMFPESDRSDYAVRQRFDILTKQEGNGSNSSQGELQEKSRAKSTTGELKQETPSEKKEEPAAPGPAIPEDGMIVGCKVRQVKGKDRAYGIGTVQGAGVDNLRVKFISSTKVLPRDHFELVKVEKREAEGVKA